MSVQVSDQDNDCSTPVAVHGYLVGPRWMERQSRMGPRRVAKEDGQRGKDSAVEDDTGMEKTEKIGRWKKEEKLLQSRHAKLVHEERATAMSSCWKTCQSGKIGDWKESEFDLSKKKKKKTSECAEHT